MSFEIHFSTIFNMLWLILIKKTQEGKQSYPEEKQIDKTPLKPFETS